MGIAVSAHGKVRQAFRATQDFWIGAAAGGIASLRPIPGRWLPCAVVRARDPPRVATTSARLWCPAPLVPAGVLQGFASQSQETETLPGTDLLEWVCIIITISHHGGPTQTLRFMHHREDTVIILHTREAALPHLSTTGAQHQEIRTRSRVAKKPGLDTR